MPLYWMEMTTLGTCWRVTARTRAAESVLLSPYTAPRSVTDPERAELRAVGVAKARKSIARAKARHEDPRTGARRDPGAESLAGSLAHPVAGSSSGVFSPVVRPAHAACAVAG